MTQSEISASMEADGEGDEFISVIKAGRMVGLARSEVSWVEVERHLLRLHTVTGETYQLRDTLKSLHQRWAQYGFARIHKSFLVFLPHVRELRREAEGPVVSLGVGADAALLPVSRRKKSEIKQQLKERDDARF
ncbi:MAG: LytTR family transcriptional regulator [Acidobacteria bacterium]|nr:LytTR family transcriptional regulator [Acidobacteriota bacterium]